MINLKISVITPSFNQANFLPVNLESVAKQKLADVEHIIVDPGSTDGSLEIAKQSSNVKLIAEPDRGQSDGINKGFIKSTGDILAWLNSDDFYPDADVLAEVIKCFQKNPNVDIVYGDVNFVDETGKFLRKGYINRDPDDLLHSFEYQVGIVQPAVFFRRKVFEEIGGPSEEFEYCMDYELWVRMAGQGYKWKYIPKILAHHRWWDGMKTNSQRNLSFREHFKVCDRYFNYVHWEWLDRYADYLSSKQDGIVNHAKSISSRKKKAAIKKAIDEIVTQEMLHTLNTSKKANHIKTLKFIRKNHPKKQRIYFSKKELKIVSEVSADPKAKERVAWNIFEVKTRNKKQLVSYHVPDNFDRYFDYDWHKKQLNRSRRALSGLRKDKRRETCIIVGNGPSLLKSDLSSLKGVDIIVSNFACLSPELARNAKFLTVVNDLVAKQGAIDFNNNKLVKFFPFWLANHINPDSHTFFVNATVRPEFNKNFIKSSSWRSTVSFFNMQLAYAIGYKKIILIGFDHSYIQSKEMTEGMLIKQTSDDKNHFDPRYFKGKDWQAADTKNMEKMYAIAKTAFEEDDREIVNCTIGGKLELFRRGELQKELEVKTFPRLLMIDSTPVGHNSATGQLKKTFLGDWNKSSFLQVWLEGESKLHTLELDQSIQNSQQTTLTINQIIDKCKVFQPDVIYFRPIDSLVFFELVQRLVVELGKPLIIHMMDDWPQRLQTNDSERYTKLDSRLRYLIKRSAKQLSICEAMSVEYKSRYGGDWQAVANGASLKEYPAKKYPLHAPTKSKPFIIRYMGALADDMTYNSIKDIAKVVKFIQIRYPVRFEIYTMSWCLDKARDELGNIPGIIIEPLVDEKDYTRLLSESSCLIIAYNFDPRSIEYIGLSLANKMPECLASGVPVLAYGPKEVATIQYLKEAGCAQVIDKQNQKELHDSIVELITNPKLCQQLGTSARKFVLNNLTKKMIQDKFYTSIKNTSQFKSAKNTALVGPFSRDSHAHYDETDCIAEVYSSELKGQTMIDVGAHHGWALLPFLKMDWNIFAFEPDNKNRAILVKKLSEQSNQSRVTLDIRCVSNKSQKDISFYQSEQSTGISGLSAFHDTHIEAQHVNTVTLTEYFKTRELPQVDFLKIDTEGHDLFVLQGFPWERLKPVVIECEFEDAKTVALGYRFEDLANFLVDKGYTVYVSEWHPIIKYGIQHDWKQLTSYPCKLSNNNAWGNLLAFLNPIDEAILESTINKLLTFKGPKKPEVPDNTNLSIKDANLLYREGNYKKAMDLYLQLYKLHSLEMYADNALMAAKEQGIDSVKNIDELNQYVKK